MCENNLKASYLEGPIIKKMIMFALPLVATSIFLQMFSTLDMAIAGRFISTKALAAVGSTTIISSLFIEFFLGFSNAANIIISQFVGKGDRENTKDAVHTAVFASAIVGIIIAVFGIIFTRPILCLLSVPRDIFALSEAYLRTYFLSIPFLMVYNFCSAIFRSKGETRLPMICLVSGGILKAILNLVFVALFDMGVIGMGLATVFANLLSAVLLIIFLLKRTDELKLSLKELKPKKRVIINLLKIGLPTSFLGSVFSISNLCTQTAINGLGSSAIAASTAAASIEIYVQFFGNAFAQAATTFTGQNYGAKNYHRLNRITLTALGLCNIVSIILSLIVFAFGGSLLKIFVSDAVVIALGLTRMKYTLLFKPVQAVMDIMSGCLQGYGYTLVPAIVSAFSVCGVRLLWIFTVFPHNRSLETLMMIYPITQGLAAISHTVCYLLLVRKIKQKGKI
jgi:putative MATE family efflux protein